MIRRTVLVFPLILMTACTATRPRSGRSHAPTAPIVWTPAALRERAKAIDQRASTLRKTDGTWESRDGSATYTGHFDGPALLLIRERVGMGDYGAATNAYYFADGKLFHYQSDGSQTTFDPPSPPTTEDVLVRILFDPQGGILEGRKTLNGNPAKLEKYEVSDIVHHADMLRGRLSTARAAPPSGPARIRFAAGATSARVTASVTPGRPAEWLVTAKTGQTMRVRLEGSRSGASLAVLAGERILVAEATEWTGTLPRTGDYRIRTFLPADDTRRTPVELTLVVEIE